MMDYPSSRLLPRNIHSKYPINNWIERSNNIKDFDKNKEKLELLSLVIYIYISIYSNNYLYYFI